MADTDNGCNCWPDNPLYGTSDVIEYWNVYYYNNSFKQYVYYGINHGNTVNLCNNVLYYFEPVINSWYTSAIANCLATLKLPIPPLPPNNAYICNNNSETSCYNCGLCGYEYHIFNNYNVDGTVSISPGCNATISVQRTSTGPLSDPCFFYVQCYCCNSACDNNLNGIYYDTGGGRACHAFNNTSGADQSCINDCVVPSNPISINFNDSAVSPCSLGGGGQFLFSKIARFTDFGFDIPLNATITGIQAKLNKQADQNFTIEDSVVKLLIEHRMKGDNKANFDTSWLDINQEEIYGEQTDLWGLSDITPEKLNSEGFGVALEIINSNSIDIPQANLNSIEMKVFYEQNGNQTYQTKIIDWDGAIYPLF